MEIQVEMMPDSLFVGVPLFLAYAGTAAVLTLVYIVVYMWVTPHPEITLIRENNLAAAVAFGGVSWVSVCRWPIRLRDLSTCSIAYYGG